MSWWNGRSVTWVQSFVASVVKCGPIPQHIAVIMDGNRRYAKARNLDVEFWHSDGFEKMKEMTYWCSVLGVREVTAYMFSIENFRRTQREVDALMNLIRSQFQSIANNLEDFMKDDICVRIIGNLDLLPPDLKSLAAQITFWTKNNETVTINLACAYTSRDEMTKAIQTVVGGVRSGYLEIADIDQNLLSKCMFTSASPDPDMIIRTSGETRLSDFLLWQSRYAKLYVENFCWPELTFWNLLKNVFLYQRTYDKHPKNYQKLENPTINEKQEYFLKKLESFKMKNLEQYINNN